MFNDILWDNRAGTRALGTVIGLGIAGDAVADRPLGRRRSGRGRSRDRDQLDAPGDHRHDAAAATRWASTRRSSPEYDTSVAFQPWRTNPNLVGAIMVATDVPPTLMGDYHLPSTSPAVDAAPTAPASVGGINAPTLDIDGERPAERAALRPRRRRDRRGCARRCLPDDRRPRCLRSCRRRPRRRLGRRPQSVDLSDPVEPGPGPRRRAGLVEGRFGVQGQPGGLPDPDPAEPDRNASRASCSSSSRPATARRPTSRSPSTASGQVEISTKSAKQARSSGRRCRRRSSRATSSGPGPLPMGR